MKRKPTTLAAIHPNAGISAKYRANLNKLLRSVRNEVLQAVEQYKDVPPQPIALDAHPLVEAINRIMIKWITRLDNVGEEIAREFMSSTVKNYNKVLDRQLRKAGFTVRFQMTDDTKKSLQEATGMNVGLIKSIPQQYLADVSKYVNEAVSGGFNIGLLTDNLQHAYHIGRNRAKLIARDQAAKAHAVIEQSRRKELGIKKAVWRHVGGSKEPRQSHIKASGKTFDIDKGMHIDGEWILPGEKINCGCVSRSILEF